MTALAPTRAVAHWAWRMFRRDWRGQSLVLALLTVTVAVSSYGAAFGHALAPNDQAAFGSASARISFSTKDSGVAAREVAAARAALGTVDEITDSAVAIPGSVRQLDLRTQDPHGAYGASTLWLGSGRYPDGPNEIALSVPSARFLGATLGSTVTVGGAARRVVGVVENPAQLDDEFGIVSAPPPGALIRYSLLVRASTRELAAFRARATVPGGVTIDTPAYYSHDLGVLLVAALGMIVVAVVALTAFLVLAQRRVRQLGMLAAIGATRRQVRNVTVIHGLIVGAIAAVLGTAVAALAWMATSSTIAEASGRRQSWAGVPTWLIITPGVMGIVASAVAAWWPGRAMARVPIVRALSNRPLEAPHSQRSALYAFLALVVGVLCLRYAHQRNAVLMIIGLAAMIAAILLTTPLAIRALTAHSRRLPVTERLASRELGRNQSRSAAALATVTIAVGVSVAAVVVTAANAHPPTAGNLSSRQILIPGTDSRDPSVVPARSDAQADRLDRAAAQVRAAALPHASLIPLSVAVDPGVRPSALAVASGGADAVQVVRRAGSALTSYPVYVATPQLLAELGMPSAARSTSGYYTVDPGGSWSLMDARRTTIGSPMALHAHAYTSLPQVLVDPAVVAAHRWREVRAGWLLQNPAPIGSAQQRAARVSAARVGLAVETRDSQAYLGTLRWAFAIGGVAVTLAIIAIALVLLRTQTARDQQILAAVGAPSRARRAIATATAGALATSGAVLGIAGAYLTLILAYSDTLGRLSNIPWSALITIVLGIPVLSLVTTWLTTSRQPPSLGRPVID